MICERFPPEACCNGTPAWDGRCTECDLGVGNERHFHWVGSSFVLHMHLPCFANSCKGFAPDLDRARTLIAKSQQDAALYEACLIDLADVVSEPSVVLNDLCDTITIVEVYDKVLGLEREAVGGRTEGIMCLCPLHPETRPSAWFNVEKGTLCCGHDFTGLNKYGLYAHARGLSNEPTNFHRLKRMMVWELRKVDPYSTDGGAAS